MRWGAERRSRRRCEQQSREMYVVARIHLGDMEAVFEHPQKYRERFPGHSADSTLIPERKNELTVK